MPELFEEVTEVESVHQQAAEEAMFALADHLEARGVSNAIMMGAVTHVLCAGLIGSFGTNADAIEHMNKILPHVLDEVRKIYGLPEPRKS